ncbi:MAG: hypothetical protein WD226_10640 [Planctomycetota bacterium]
MHASLLRSRRRCCLGHDPRTARAGQAAWALVAGLALAGLGLVAGAQVGGDPTPGSETPRTYAPSAGGFGTADSNGSMIAVTGHDVTGGSLLFLVDTETKQLAVYTAQGGTSSTSEVRFVGARRIDLDLQVNGYNDESEYSWKQLDAEFKKKAAGSTSSPAGRRRSGAPSIPDDVKSGTDG